MTSLTEFMQPESAHRYAVKWIEPMAEIPRTLTGYFQCLWLLRRSAGLADRVAREIGDLPNPLTAEHLKLLERVAIAHRVYVHKCLEFREEWQIRRVFPSLIRRLDSLIRRFEDIAETAALAAHVPFTKSVADELAAYDG